MSNILQTKIRAWDDNGAAPGARLLTVAAVVSLNGVMPGLRTANMLRLFATISGTAIDELRIRLHGAPSGAVVASAVSVPVVNTVVGGIGYFQPGILALVYGAPFVGLCSWEIPITPGQPLMVWAYRVGGAADSAAIIQAELCEV